MDSTQWKWIMRELVLGFNYDYIVWIGYGNSIREIALEYQRANISGYVDIAYRWSYEWPSL